MLTNTETTCYYICKANQVDWHFQTHFGDFQMFNSIMIQKATDKFLSKGKSITVLPPEVEPVRMSAGFHHQDEVIDVIEGVDSIFNEEGGSEQVA